MAIVRGVPNYKIFTVCLLFADLEMKLAAADIHLCFRLTNNIYI